MSTSVRMQLLAWFLPVQTPSRGSGHGSEDYLYAGETHIFRRNRTTQLIKCTPWSTKLHLHPTIIKKMKTFLEVEGKTGPIPTPHSQFRPPLPDTNPNIRKDYVTEKRKRATPKKFRPVTPKPTTACPPLPEAPPKPKNDAPLPSVAVEESIPWPGTVKISGNLFQDRNWLFPSNYLENKTENEPKLQLVLQVPSLRLKKKNLTEMNNPQRNADGDWVVHCANPKNRRKIKAQSSNRSCHLKQNSKS